MTNVKKIILLAALILLTVTSAEAAEEPDLPFDNVASTYTKGETEMLALVRMKADGALLFLVMAEDAQGIGLVPYSTELYNFYLNKGDTEYPPLIFGMMLPNQAREQVDDDLGDWNNDLHMLPVYVLFTVKDGKVICQKPFYSAAGLNPSHYQGRIQNPTHIRLIEIFMTHMPRLHEVVQAQGITLP